MFEASLNAAAYLLDKGKGCNGTFKSMSKIEDAFRKYRNVAHLCAAARVIAFTRHLRSSGNFFKDIMDEERIEELLLFITLAQNYQEFGTSFRPKRSPRPKREFLLDCENIWSFPKSLFVQYPMLKYEGSAAQPLDDLDIKALRDYEVM